MTISAKIIKDSVSPDGIRIITYELEYPRIIHSDLMTHRVFSRNSASSRAIPVSSVLELVETNPAMPVHWGKNQPGMQAKEEVDGSAKQMAEYLWKKAATYALEVAGEMKDVNLHKQVVNRILEPYQHMKVVLTSTDWSNWFWLRKHEDADPTIQELAAQMFYAFQSSTPEKLFYGDWHLPYVKIESRDIYNKQVYLDENDNEIGLQDALMISVSCCAQVSYRKSDTGLEKAQDIFKRLIESEPCHASPTEHQAFCIHAYRDNPKFVTHTLRNGTVCSGNFRGWGQYRQIIPKNVKNDQIHNTNEQL